MERTDKAERALARKPLATASVLDTIALALLVVGGLNWGLYGLMDLDLVALLFGDRTVAARAVYVVVGLAALYALSLFPRLSGPAPRGRPDVPRD